ncbi:MAG: SPOR domain-containing protein [Sulfuritalea sp.]|nr:SPOR domain-containing protein [Sulfuritalea sp.]
MTQEDRRTPDEAPDDEATLLKKRARRRLIGAVALALFAAIVLPMVMDRQPAQPVKDIQVHIPSPDEGAPRKISPPVKPAEPAEARPIAKSEAKPEPRPEPRPETQAEPKSEARPAAVGGGAEAWEVQLGAYADPGRVRNLVAKIKELGLPAYTERIETPGGPRTRVRAGPFASREEAEKARVRVRVIGVDGPVARKP